VLNVNFNNISVILWRSALLVEKTGGNHRPVEFICGVIFKGIQPVGIDFFFFIKSCQYSMFYIHVNSLELI
jgi:hypothetical protein